MIFENLPQVISKQIYDEATQLYAKRVGKRATAVYQVGAVSFPGLSDLDLLVVVANSRRDNSQFFSVFDRLAPRFHSLFLHQPFVLPEKALDVFQHANHSEPRLVAGFDVLAQRRPLATEEARWCRLLEAYCNLDVYLSQCLERGRTPARLAIAVSSSMRYPLQEFDALFSSDHALPYAQQIDAARAALLATPQDGQRLVAEIWNILYHKMRWLTTNLTQLLPLGKNESPRQFGIRFLQGRLSFDSLDSAAVFERRKSIDFYHNELRRLRFSYGQVFFFAAYGTASHRYQQRRLENRFFSLCYKVHDRLVM